MSAHIQYPDGTRQWVAGTFYAGRPSGFTKEGFARYSDGFTVFNKAAPLGEQHHDYGPDHCVLALAPDSMVVDWSRRA